MNTKKWPTEQELTRRHNILYNYLSQRDWGLSPEENLMRTIVLLFEKNKKTLSFLLFDHEYLMDNMLPQEGKGDLLFVSLERKEVLVVEVKAILEATSEIKGKKKIKKNKLKSQVQIYKNKATQTFPQEATILGLGITDETYPQQQLQHFFGKEIRGVEVEGGEGRPEGLGWVKDGKFLVWEVQKGWSLPRWVKKGSTVYQEDMFGLLPALALQLPNQISVTSWYKSPPNFPFSQYHINLTLDGNNFTEKSPEVGGIPEARQIATLLVLESSGLWGWLVEKHKETECMA